MMRLTKGLAVAGLMTSLAMGQVVNQVSMAVTNEIVPAGGVVQVKVRLTEPKPIIRTGMSARFDESFFDEYLGISAAAGLHGVAVVNGGRLRLELTTLTPGGYDPDYPILMVAVKVKPGLPVGYRVPVELDLANSSWLDAAGVPFEKESKPGSVTIGGTQFVSNVIPGGGVLQPGQTFKVLGGGFGSSTKARMENAKLRSVKPNELLFEVKLPMTLDGEGVVVENKQKEREKLTYFSYLRGVKVNSTANVALRGMVPVFASGGSLEARAGLSGNAQAVVGIGLQNPTQEPVTVKVECEDVLALGMGEASVVLGPGEVTFRSFEEVFGKGLPVGAFVLKAKAKTAFQMAVAEVDAATGAIHVPAVRTVEAGTY